MGQFHNKFKLNLNAERLVYSYASGDRQIHMLSVSRKITAWANLSYFILGSQCGWPSKNEVQDNMLERFCLLYPTSRVVLDGTEIFCKLQHHCHSCIPVIRATTH